MKISLSWLQEFIDIKLPVEEIASLLTDCGLEVEGIEQFDSVVGGLEGLVIGEVTSCEAHPNADRLKLTKVDVGTDELLSIVCGAPNVQKGQKVVVASVGTTIYPLSGEPFQIKKAKIRGEASEGMICAEDEIGIGESHDGIMVLDEKAKVGTTASSYFNLESDFVFEIGLTPNRADAMSHFGVARDLLAVLKTKGLVDASKSLNWKRANKLVSDNTSLPIELDIQNTDACPRYAGICLSNVDVKDSPSWLQNRLKSLGLKPINNVVDVTNFILHHIGQPLHAFDYDKITEHKVVVRTAKAGSNFVTLDEEKRTMDAHDLMICNADDAMCIAGVFGGLDSGVTKASKNIFLESAYFDPVYIRKTAKRHALSTDASFRYERGIDPNITLDALYEASKLLKEVAGAQIASELVESYPTKIEDFKVAFNYQNCNRLVGQEIAKEEINNILSSLDIEVIEQNGEDLLLKVPSYRVDVQREADIIEEIVRIYGYNNIKTPEKMSISINPAPRVDQEALKNRVADLLVSNGFFECMSNSLSSSAPYSDDKTLVQILNPLSSELNIMRKEMLYDLLQIVELNQKHKNINLKLFEFGKVYETNEDSYFENEFLSIAMTGSFDDEKWNSPKRKSDPYLLKAIAEKILKSLGLFESLKSKDTEDNGFFVQAYELYHRKKKVMALGFVDKTKLKNNELRGDLLYAELDWSYIKKLCLNHSVDVKDIPKFQEVRRDLALLLDKNISFDDLRKLAFEADQKILKEVSLFDVYEGKNLPEGKKSYALSYMLRDNNATLTDDKVDKVIRRIYKSYQDKLGVELRIGEL